MKKNLGKRTYSSFLQQSHWLIVSHLHPLTLSQASSFVALFVSLISSHQCEHKMNDIDISIHMVVEAINDHTSKYDILKFINVY